MSLWQNATGSSIPVSAICDWLGAIYRQSMLGLSTETIGRQLTADLYSWARPPTSARLNIEGRDNAKETLIYFLEN